MMGTLTWVYNVSDHQNPIVHSFQLVHGTGKLPVDAESLRKAIWVYQDVLEIVYPSYSCDSGDWNKVLEIALVRCYGRISISLNHREGGLLRVIAQQ